MDALSPDPFADVVNVHWGGETWGRAGFFGFTVGFTIFDGATQIEISGGPTVPFPIQSHILLAPGQTYNISKSIVYTDKDGKTVGGGDFAQAGNSSGAGGGGSAHWNEHMTFPKKDAAVAWKPFGGATNLDFQCNVITPTSDPDHIPPLNSARFDLAGSQSLIDPKGVVTLVGDQQGIQAVWHWKFNGGVYDLGGTLIKPLGPTNSISFTGSVDMINGKVTKLDIS